MLKFIKKLIKRDDDSHEFKPLLVEVIDEPVSPLGRSTFWIIIAAMLFTVLWLIFGEIDVVVTARGKLIPKGHVQIVQSIDNGIIGNIRVQEGDYVKKGDVLMEIDPSLTEPAVEAAGKTLNVLLLDQQRIKSILKDKPFIPDTTKYSQEEVKTQRDLYESIKQTYQDQVSAKSENLNLIKEQLENNQVQLEKTQDILATGIDQQKRLEAVLDIIPKSSYEEVVNKNNSYQAQVAQYRHKLQELKVQERQVKQELSYVKSSFESRLLEELSNVRKNINNYEANYKQREFVNQKQLIKSPVTGYVNKLIMHTIGGVVAPAQELIAIVPEDEPLVVSAKVLNKDIGFIKKDMPVSIKVDTFSFQKYGIIDGKVTVVGRDSIEDEQMGLVYEVKVEPEQKTLVVEGEEKALEPGMSLIADIKIGKRRIIEFFIYPLIKYYKEGISVR